MEINRSNQIKTIVIIGLFAALVFCFYGWVWSNKDNKTETSQIRNGIQEQTFKWRMVTTWPKNLPGLGVAPERFAALINEISNGRLMVEVFGAGEIVPALQVFDAVSEGSVQMGHGAAYYWKGKIPASVFFTTIPFGMTIQEQNGWFFHGGGLELWRKAYKPFNVIPFPGGSTGVQMGGWYNKPIDSLEDLRGLKMRIPGLAGEVFTRAGGTAVSVAGGELFTALQTGVIDATEWVGPYNDVAFGFHKIAKYYYYPGWHEPGSSLEFVINQDAFDELPADLQAMVKVVTRAINQDMLDDYAVANSRAYSDLLKNDAIDIRPFPNDVLIKLKTMASEILEEEAAKDTLFAEVYASYKAYIDKAFEYTKVSEKAYVEARDL